MVVLCSGTSSPGVTSTTLALALVWSAAHAGRRALVIDADVHNSGILTGFLQAGVSAGGGVLAVAGERTAVDLDVLLEHAVALDASPSAPLVLAGVTDPIHARTLGGAWAGLAGARGELHDEGFDVLVDLGRLGHRHEPTVLVEAAELVVVVMGSTLPSVTASRSALRGLRSVRGPGPRTTGLVVGEGQPYPAREIGRELDLDPIATLPDDRSTAQVLAFGGEMGRRFDRTPLLRAARTVAVDLTDRVDAFTTAGARS